MGLCGNYDLRDSRIFDGISSVVDVRFHPGNLCGEASDERQQGTFWVDCRCSSSDEGRKEFLFLHGGY
jgi:hypothetical protein